MADRGARKSKRGMRDEAGVGPNPRDARRLVPMKDLDNYKVVDGEPDIRGWSHRPKNVGKGNPSRHEAPLATRHQP